MANRIQTVCIVSFAALTGLRRRRHGNETEAHSLVVAEEFEALFTSYQADGGSSATVTTAARPRWHPRHATCDEDYEATNGCDCEGRAIGKMHTTVTAASEAAASADAKNAVCYTNGLGSYFQTSHVTRRPSTNGWFIMVWRMIIWIVMDPESTVA